MTAKEEAVACLKKANGNYGQHSFAIQIKAAVFDFITNEVGVTDKDILKDAFVRFMETPSWFGASANAMTDSGVIEAQARKQRVVPEFK